MRIGIDARLWDESGVGRYTRNLVANLKAIDRKNTYVLFARKKNTQEIAGLIAKSNWEVVEADIRWHTLEEQIRFPSILNKEHLDLVHFPYFSVPLLYKKPYIVTIHDLILHHFPTGEASTLPFPFYYLKLLAYRYVLKHAAKRSEKIIAVSHATQKEIIDHLRVANEKVVVTYEGVSATVKGNSQKPVTLDPYFLYVGNAYPHKNLSRLLSAFAVVLVKHPTIKLVFVGREDFFHKKLKKQVVGMFLGNSVLFYTGREDEELGLLYKNALALVMPSLMEGFGLPVVEAMANGCLVLVSSIPALKEITENAAFYFDPYDTDDIAEKLTFVMNASPLQLEPYKKEGIKRANLFSWEKMAKETLAVYESCARI